MFDRVIRIGGGPDGLMRKNEFASSPVIEGGRWLHRRLLQSGGSGTGRVKKAYSREHFIAGPKPWLMTSPCE